MRKILILGATSAIATATARLLAAQGHHLFLAARNEASLRSLADDLRTRGASQVESARFEATALNTHAELIATATKALDGLDTVLVAYGSLPDQAAIQNSPSAVVQDLQMNFVSVASLITIVAAQFEQQGRGTIVVISSVAGDRGRATNYVYGSAKAGVTAFLSGLRQRLHAKGVDVITIKPGLVDTPMTASFRKGALWATPEKVAAGIVRAMQTRKTTAYLPGFWFLIMTIIRLLPERVFMRTRF